MRYREFLTFLTPKDKLIYTVGACLSRLGVKSSGFERLKNERMFLLKAKELNFLASAAKNELMLERDFVKVSLRQNSSDQEVFEQIFFSDEYGPVIECIQANDVGISTIVDAGSNIGLSSLKFLWAFRNAKIICLEPDPENFAQLSKNLATHQNVVLLKQALWHRDEKLFLSDKFRDQKHWSRSVSPVNTESQFSIQGVSVNDLIRKYNIESIDLLKIDIEGSENAIFNESNDLSFLAKVKVIAIEIHDEFNCRKRIYELLRYHKFVLFSSGELTVGLKIY